MNKLYSIEIQGRRVPIREYSFLDNGMTHQSVKASAISALKGAEQSSFSAPVCNTSLTAFAAAAQSNVLLVSAVTAFGMNKNKKTTYHEMTTRSKAKARGSCDELISGLLYVALHSCDGCGISCLRSRKCFAIHFP